MSLFKLDTVPPFQDGTIVDLGMHTGEFARQAIAKFQPKRFLGVEMLREFIPQLTDEFSRNLEYLVIWAAVGEESEYREIRRVPTWLASSSLLAINPESSKWYGRDLRQTEDGETIHVVTLDRLCELYGIQSIDLLKIDVQGYEGRVLRGASQILDKTNCVFIEVLFCQHYFGQSTPEEIDQLLTSHGLHLQEWLWRCDQEGDALYVR